MFLVQSYVFGPKTNTIFMCIRDYSSGKCMQKPAVFKILQYFSVLLTPDTSAMPNVQSLFLNIHDYSSGKFMQKTAFESFSSSAGL